MASFIDEVLIILVTLPLLYFIYGVSFFDSPGTLRGPGHYLISYLFPATATVIFWRLMSATPGKMAKAARVVDARTGGTPTTGPGVGRYLAYAISAIPFFLGFIWIAFDSKKQGRQDKLAGTVVVH